MPIYIVTLLPDQTLSSLQNAVDRNQIVLEYISRRARTYSYTRRRYRSIVCLQFFFFFVSFFYYYRYYYYYYLFFPAAAAVGVAVTYCQFTLSSTALQLGSSVPCMLARARMCVRTYVWRRDRQTYRRPDVRLSKAKVRVFKLIFEETFANAIATIAAKDIKSLDGSGPSWA